MISITKVVEQTKSKKIPDCLYSQIVCKTDLGELCFERRVHSRPRPHVRDCVFLKRRGQKSFDLLDVEPPSVLFGGIGKVDLDMKHITRAMTGWYKRLHSVLSGFKQLTVTVYILDENDKCDMSFNIDIEGKDMRPEVFRDAIVDSFTKKLTKLKNVTDFTVCH